MKTQLPVKHLYNRAAFGLSPVVRHHGAQAALKDLMHSAKIFSPISVIEKPSPEEEVMLSKMEKKEKKMRSRNDIIVLNTTWGERFLSPEGVLREKMTLFWHDYFACRAVNPYMAQKQNNTLRKHALGNFGDLLLAVSKDPAMLQFLNNQQNKKNSPNENFAREVLELFTLGRGHYTEADIRNAARAFTGWSFDGERSEFTFRAKVHDTGPKTFRGKTGQFSGEDILAMVLEDRQTSRFVTEKIWQYLVSTEVMDEAILSSLAESFYDSGYSIKKLLQDIFSSDWFYEDRFMGNKIKSPVDLYVGIMTQTGGKFENPESMVFLQRALGQILFVPPNVGGWPIGKEWIDSSSLTFRMSLPAIILKNASTDFEAKDDGDVNNATNKAKASRLSFVMNWQPIVNQFMKSGASGSLEAIEHYLLARPTSAENRQWVTAQAEKSADDTEFVQKAFVGFMSLPEYQVC